ncbi:MAG TPA: cytochrome c biogenesis protein CcdA [Methanospirillum sp.]|nr:cytochrome c biogenesis protein CcdA [Methanospirillum sp.]
MDLTPETWILSFLAGLYTPLGAMCVLPLYPGYIAFLASRTASGRGTSAIFLGTAVTAGVIGAMLAFGYLFVSILQLSTGLVIGYLGPAVYLLLAVMSIGMILGFDIGRLIPSIHSPEARTPWLTAMLFGAFFGLVALPCNPASIILLFALSTTTADFLSNFINFVIFGVGMATPLLVLSAFSMERNRRVIRFFTSHHILINRLAGVVMLIVALYYLIFVFLNEYI